MKIISGILKNLKFNPNVPNWICSCILSISDLIFVNFDSSFVTWSVSFICNRSVARVSIISERTLKTLKKCQKLPLQSSFGNWAYNWLKKWNKSSTFIIAPTPLDNAFLLIRFKYFSFRSSFRANSRWVFRLKIWDIKIFSFLSLWIFRMKILRIRPRKRDMYEKPMKPNSTIQQFLNHA